LPACPDPRSITKAELFLGFLKIGTLGFGGVAAWARHVIIEERRWLSDSEYAELLGIGQILPGPNTLNAAIMIGDRFQGAAGALCAVLGYMAMPLVIIILASLVYDRFASVPGVNAALIGAAAAAAGLVLGTGIKMARNARRTPHSIAFVLAAFVTIGLLQWPMVPVIAVLAPLAVACEIVVRRL
jgi:chromate transporter